MRKQAKESPDPKNWSLFVGILIIPFSLGALHRFCDEYSESTRNPLTAPGYFQVDDFAVIPAEPLCTWQLGAFTLFGAFGVVCLVGAWAVHFLASSRRQRLVANALAVVGRLIALLSWGIVVLMLVLFNRF